MFIQKEEQAYITVLIPENSSVRKTYNIIYIELLKYDNPKIEVGEVIRYLLWAHHSSLDFWSNEFYIGTFFHKQCYYNCTLSPWEIKINNTIINFEVQNEPN